MPEIEFKRLSRTQLVQLAEKLSDLPEAERTALLHRLETVIEQQVALCTEFEAIVTAIEGADERAGRALH